ncbi:MAG: vWA domain-containing protein [Planctomycetota bacterium]|nr:vWA domain-containing protein [Planctomycetota bacterium]
MIVQAVDSTGMPFPNCQVELNTSALTEPVTVVTRTDGRAIFLGSRDGLSDEATISVRIISPNGFELAETELSSQFENGEMTTKISVNSSSGAQIADSLDLAFVLDCTGSMGDEIRYIQAELKAICGMVDNLYPDVKQRYALVAYRDNGDSFVSRRYDFTASLEEIQNDLNAQEADGGGDFPEAVHVALAEASQLSWSGGNTARVMFHLLDAPPHDNMVGESLNALSAIRSKGIAYYPVVASGSDKLTELLMRTGAILTGGRYIFLTDHSGVGNPHAKPEVPSYDVELLADLMVRMIATELEGVEVPAKKIIEAK